MNCLRWHMCCHTWILSSEGICTALWVTMTMHSCTKEWQGTLWAFPRHHEGGCYLPFSLFICPDVSSLRWYLLCEVAALQWPHQLTTALKWPHQLTAALKSPHQLTQTVRDAAHVDLQGVAVTMCFPFNKRWNSHQLYINNKCCMIII